MSFPARFTRGLIHVPVLATGSAGRQRVRLVLDTGASRTLISREIMSILGYDISSTSFRLTTASGNSNVAVVPTQEVSALGHTVRGLHVVCHSIPESTRADGLLGLDFFKDQRLVIDLRQQTVYVD